MSNEKVLFIFPPSSWGTIERFCQPLGALSLVTVLRQQNIDTHILDLSAEGWFPRKLAHYIKQNQFTHLGVTILTPFRRVAYEILQLAKKVNPNIITLVGGPHVTYMKENIFSESPFIDIAVSGEAESQIVDIIQTTTKKKFYETRYIENINELPFPERKLLRHIKYNKMNNIWINDSASMNVGRGCQWRKCRFCSRDMLTLKYRRRSVENIIDEIHIVQNELNYKNIIFVDDSLKINSNFAKELFKTKVKEGLDIPFWALARADQIDDEGARLMRRANGTGLLIGIESIVPRVIGMYQKISSNPRKWKGLLDRTFELADKYDLITIATFIIGGPTETEREIDATINYCRASTLEIAQPFPFQYNIGSDFWKEAINEGKIAPTQYYSYNDKGTGTTEFTTEELFEKTLKAEFLINSPLLNASRYLRLIRKLIRQKNFSIVGQNLLRLPFIIQATYKQHPYEIVPEELHG